MKLRMHENSLFAILWRSPWWVSAAIALALIAVAKIALPESYASYAYFVALPFAGMGMLVAWKQSRRPSASRVAQTLGSLRAMAASEFFATVDAAFRRDGYAVKRLTAAGADFELTKSGRVTLVGAKRWKAARTGVEPLRELHAAAQAHEAQDCIYIAAGEISDNARVFAAEKRIRLVHDAELETLLGRVLAQS
ncbi:MAG: restriction endonuclease [Burkholderiales bacterium]|nr:restriction endonuclease [Burkholderiales bacterium]